MEPSDSKSIRIPIAALLARVRQEIWRHKSTSPLTGDLNGHLDWKPITPPNLEVMACLILGLLFFKLVPF